MGTKRGNCDLVETIAGILWGQQSSRYRRGTRPEARRRVTLWPQTPSHAHPRPTPPLHHRKRPPAKETKLNTYTTHAQKRTDNEKSSLKSWSPGVTASVRVGTGAASTTAWPSTHARASVKTTAARGGRAARCCGPAIIVGGTFFFFFFFAAGKRCA